MSEKLKETLKAAAIKGVITIIVELVLRWLA